MAKKLVYRSLIFIDKFHWAWLVLAAPFFLFPSPFRSIALLIVPGLWVLRLFIVKQEKTIKNDKNGVERGRLKDEDRIEIEDGKKIEKAKSIENGRLKIEDEGFAVSPLNLSLLVLMLMVLVSTWATYSVEQSLEKISGVILGLGVFYAVVRIGKNFIKWGISLAGFLAGGVAWAGLGILALDYQVRFSFLAPIINRIPDAISGLPGAESGLQHNAVGGTILWYLPLFIVLSIYLLFSDVEGLRLKVEDNNEIENRKLKIEDWVDNRLLLRFARNNFVSWIVRIGFWFAMLFVGGVLVLTQSRGSYLAFLITLGGMAFFLIRRKWRWVYVGVITVLVAAGGGLVYHGGGWEQLVSEAGLADQSGLSINTLEGRVEIWSRAIYGIQDFAITGMGMNTFREVVHVLYPLFIISPDMDIAHAHNEFLQAALDLGIPGLMSFISIYVISFWMLARVWKESKSQYVVNLKQVIVLGLGGGLFGHMVFGMADAITLGAKPGIFYWYLLGLIASLYKLTVEDENNKLKVEITN